MNRKTADRIIVKSNARMKMVLDWYYENKHWLDREPFLAPMESGVVELCEEQIEFTFENTRGVVEIAIYPTVQPNIPASIVFDYLPEQMDIANRRVAPELPEPKRLALDLVLRYDKTPEKEALKYHALMLFMTYYREVIEVEQRVSIGQPRPRRKVTKRGGCSRSSGNSTRWLSSMLTPCRSLNRPNGSTPSPSTRSTSEATCAGTSPARQSGSSPRFGIRARPPTTKSMSCKGGAAR
mgnify:CR=1 FL=1